MLTYGSVCSGIEAASVAWEPLGMRPAWFAEIEPFPAAVLAHRWPHVPNLGDMVALPEKILAAEIEAPDVLVGGTPCQAFSVAGLRGSLADARGNLTIILIGILNAIDAVRQQAGKPPALLVWENVPGVLSTRDNAFGSFLGGLAGEECALEPPGKKWTNAGAVFGAGRSIAWRVLDAQFFGVPQRRRRVFLVAGAGAVGTAEILFERQGGAGDFKPGKPPRQNPAADAGKGAHWDSWLNPHPPLSQSHNAGGIGASNQEIFGRRGAGLVSVRMRGFGDYVVDAASSTVKARDYKDATDLVIHGRQDPCVSDKAFALDCQPAGNTNVIAISGNIIGRDAANGGNGLGVDDSGVCYTLTAADRHVVAFSEELTASENIAPTLQRGGEGGRHDGVMLRGSVRRMMPVECERLQGFPDGHTLIPWRGKAAADCPDGLRYKALGNSMAVPVMRWIGMRMLAHVGGGV